MATSTSRHLGGTLFNLPENSKQPAHVREAFEKLEKLDDARVKAWAEVEVATSTRMNAQAADEARLATIYGTDPGASDVNPTQLHDDAVKTEAAAFARVRGLDEACRRAVVDVRAAIDTDRDVWAKSSAANAAKGITKLTTALKLAETAQAELRDSIGVLGMLRGINGHEGIAVAIGPGSHYFDLNDAVTSLRNAVVEASRELGELK